MLRIASTILAFSVLTFSFGGFAYTTQQTWLDPQFVSTAFINVALRNEYSEGKKPLMKWRQPIKIWVQHRVDDKELHDSLTNAHLNHLSQITGHPIERVSTREQANIIWVYTRESLWREDIEREMGTSSLKNIKGAICKAGFRKNRDSSIHSAAIIIPVDQAREQGKLLACIVEEITQVLGLPNDSDSAYPSIFNDNTPEDLLSPLDVVLLKLLYEPELKVGMTESQVKPIVKKLLVQYKKNGTLNGAVSVAKSGELFILVGY
ncbi:DUF2927 domain-containing protein [Vibrio sp. RE86]|uniref:DUF2927 domain-containing protein n=1 Tax=Vibrio sp. RE86 TaxID=2607605 RepID=UPI001493B7FB|nr:DUF2927 domain-containing protein [Vibrio sp. RE86]NOH79572.1 DUF2927 domain-containing protein [Vibrio sp. RE86]